MFKIIAGLIFFYLLNVPMIFSKQKDSTQIRTKIALEANVTHSFFFQEVYIPCNGSLQSLYEGYAYKSYWTPSLDLLYNYHLYYENKKYLSNYSLTAGLKISYGKDTWRHDSACSSTTPVIQMFVDSRNITLGLPFFFSYRQRQLIIRGGITFSFFSFKTEEYIDPNNKWQDGGTRNVFYFSFDHLSFRMDYVVKCLKRQPYIFGYLNGFTPNEFGAGIGIPILN